MNLNVITPQDASRIAGAVKETEKVAREVATQGTTQPATAPQVTTDDLYAKILKYIPAPLIGLYLLAVNLFLSVFQDRDTHRALATTLTFVLFGVLIVVYLARRGVRRKSQLVVSLVAFVAWAMASPGPFQELALYESWWGTLALIVVAALFLAVKVPPLADDVINETKP